MRSLDIHEALSGKKSAYLAHISREGNSDDNPASVLRLSMTT